MIEWGSFPEDIELKEVDKEYEVKSGQIYGYKCEFFKDPFRDEESYLNETLGRIVASGDEPIYIRVDSKGFGATQTELFFVAKHKGSTPLAVIIAEIIVALGIVAFIIYEVYYIATGKPIPPPAFTGLGALIILIIILLLLTIGEKK